MNSIHEEYIRQLQQALAACDGEKLERLYALIDAARSQGRQIFVLGNGGSAATSSHWQGRQRRGRAPRAHVRPLRQRRYAHRLWQ